MKPAPGHIGGNSHRRWLAAALALLTLGMLAACGETNPSSPPATDVETTRPATGSDAADRAEADVQEIWEAFYLQGSKIGHGHTVVRPVRRDDRELLEIESRNHLAITRFGQRTEQNVKMQSLETLDGKLLAFTTEAALGPSPMVVSGRVEDGQMVLTTDTQGRRAATRIPWPDDVRGFRGIEQSLAARPMQPGEKRSLRMLMPLVNQIVEVELAAAEHEMTSVLGIDVRLLRVESVTRLPGGQSIEATLWTDEQGEVIKNRMAALDQESFRTTPELALAPARGEATFDLGLDAIVKVDPPLARPHATRHVRYRVELASGDPAEVFATGPTQSVRRLNDRTAEITVRSLRPSELAAPAAPPANPPAEYLAANSFLQIDDPRIRRMAAEAQGTASDPREVAVALEDYVHRTVSEKNFSHGFATAAEVAESLEGDCTEHAVLLAALLRSCGIASRVAIGLVYVEPAGGFGYHMWTEAYLHGQWVPLDGIMGRGGTSAAYLKLADASLEGATAYSSFLAVAQVLGQLKVRAIGSE